MFVLMEHSFIHPAGQISADSMQARIIHCWILLLLLLKNIRVDIVIDSFTDICINQDETDNNDEDDDGGR